MLRLVYLHVEDLLLPVVCYILNKDHHHNQSVDHNVNKHTKTHIHVYVCIKQNKLDRVCPLFDLESTTPNARLKTCNIINNFVLPGKLAICSYLSKCENNGVCLVELPLVKSIKVPADYYLLYE